MRTNAISNPFMVLHFNYSWEGIKTQLQEIIDRFPNRYKLSYRNDDDETIILVASLDFRVFGEDITTIISLSKINACNNFSMLACEAKSASGDISSPDAYERATFFIESLNDDMMMVY